MVEHSPKILAGKEKATNTATTLYPNRLQVVVFDILLLVGFALV